MTKKLLNYLKNYVLSIVHKKGCNEQVRIENAEVTGFEAAFRGMRMPMESGDRADSKYWLPNMYQEEYEEIVGDDIIWDPYHLGDNDKTLAKKLIAAGAEHRKFLRYIHVSFDITAPLYLFKELETYKVGTVSNSTSTMHKLADTPITLDCFEMDDYEELEWKDYEGFMEEYNSSFVWDTLIDALESLRKKYNKTKDKRYWKELIRLLPESWLQTRTIDLNYEVLRNIYKQRMGHRLGEWDQILAFIETLPYSELLLIDSWDDQKE